MKSILAKQDDGTIQLSITIVSERIKNTYNEVVEEMVKNANLTGFRKGKAPKKLVEEKLDQEKIREEILKKLLPNTYIEAVKEHNLKPVINPKIHIEKLEEGKDWEFKALTCETPIVKLGNYKENVKNVTAKSKIVIPGKESEPAKFEEIVKAILESIDAKIPKILVDQEVDKLLSQTLDEIKKLGLTLDQYLASTGRSADQLRNEYETKAEKDIKLEFTLARIMEEENITVDEKEIDEAILKAKDENERKNLEQNRYLLAGILRQQKTLDFLRNL